LKEQEVLLDAYVLAKNNDGVL